MERTCDRNVITEMSWDWCKKISICFESSRGGSVDMEALEIGLLFDAWYHGLSKSMVRVHMP